ncbi:acetylhydrolase [Pedobacter steynii]|uniref:Acetylhydrolase n=2 Tax=Pedobacter steynii TaxID=430522 RepID=A0A1D7QQE5_9SPHI|nr:acetylhydrolase [Pedobacter steynii]
MKRYILILLATMISAHFCEAQQQNTFKSWNPAKDSLNVIQGRGWSEGFKSDYDRLPADAENKVRKAVWNLSENSAGLSLRFRTNAENIVVRFRVKGPVQMPHMPATGVSGVDLYTRDLNGKWLWCAGKFAFGDTISYQFNHISGNDQHLKDREYTLYLPLYNSISWMEIEVPGASDFKALPVSSEKPVVVYGTSIAQGECASRPGMAWASILGRKLDRALVNLGFSGNGMLEPEVLDYIGQIDARLYVIDCLPNLTRVKSADLRKRIVNTIGTLQLKRPGVPILLTEHDGYSEAEVQPVKKKEYESVNAIMKATVDSLKKAGVNDIYLLSKEEIGQDIESMVDGVHPNDIGMMNYANAYEKKIKSIFRESEGKNAIMIPVRQRRDASTYDWETRHQEVLSSIASKQPEVVFIGNSITHFWGGLPEAQVANGKKSWSRYFGSGHVVNMGFGWDRIENVLWRIYHGELDGFSPEQIVLMIGTNNLEINTDAELLAGLDFLLEAIHSRQPASRILCMGILPRRGMESRIARLNKRIATMLAKKRINYADAGTLFLNRNQRIEESLFSDGLHPNEDGYERLGKFISNRITVKK